MTILFWISRADILRAERDRAALLFDHLHTKLDVVNHAENGGLTNTQVDFRSPDVEIYLQ